jgi:hypothetical protein
MPRVDFLLGGSQQAKDLRFQVEEAGERKVDVAKSTKRFADHGRQVEKMQLSLENLYESRAGGALRARPRAPRVVVARDQKQRRNEYGATGSGLKVLGRTSR